MCFEPLFSNRVSSVYIDAHLVQYDTLDEMQVVIYEDIQWRSNNEYDEYVKSEIVSVRGWGNSRACIPYLILLNAEA